MMARVWLRMILCVLVASSAAACCCAVPSPARSGVSNLTGIWRAEYDEREFRMGGCIDIPTGVETLTLRADGTYQQVYDDGKGYVHTSTWNNWYQDDSGGRAVLHLEGGRFYPLGIKRAESLSRGPWVYTDENGYGWGRSLELNSTEVVLFVTHHWYILKDEHEVTLDYPLVCDPDSPVYVTFYLVAPAATPAALS
jgi:hypothetical protein